MRKLLASLLMIEALLAGCALMVPGHLYPVRGPLAAQAPVPVYTVSLSGIFASGTLSATLRDGEVCRGAWAAVRRDDPSAGRMAADWDSVYGAGFFVADVLGSLTFARATLTGTQGTILNVEFFLPTPGEIAGAKGVAADSQSNVFKLAF